MLSVQPQTEPRTIIHSVSTGNELTECLLQHRQTGERVKLCIYSLKGLSMQQTREAIAVATKAKSFWDWRVISKVSSWEPF